MKKVIDAIVHRLFENPISSMLGLVVFSIGAAEFLNSKIDGTTFLAFVAVAAGLLGIKDELPFVK